MLKAYIDRLESKIFNIFSMTDLLFEQVIATTVHNKAHRIIW